MPTLKYGGGAVPTDEHGFLLNSNQWTPEIAEALARGCGIPQLTDRHWRVIAQCREEAAQRGQPLDENRIEQLVNLGRAELERLFPGNPAEQIARIAGLPRPRGGATPPETPA